MRAQVACPTEIAANAASAGGIEKAEQLRVLAVAVLQVEILCKTVFARDVLVEADVKVVGVLRNRRRENKVVHGARLVGQRDELEQSQRLLIEHVLRNYVRRGKRLVGGRIEYRHRTPIHHRL